MTDRRFPWFPITCARSDRPDVQLLMSARYIDDTTPPEVLMFHGGAGRGKGVQRVLVDTPSEFRFVDEYNGAIVVLRPTLPDDSANTTQIQMQPRIPMPVEIIGAIMKGTIAEPTIEAAVDPGTGDVHTVILSTDTGLYARYSRSWIRLFDISPIEQLNMVEIPYTDLEHYDQADEAGNQLVIGQLSPFDPPAPSAIQESPPPPETPVTASVPAMITVASAADLPDAIAYGATQQGQGSRWYIARRAKALGWAEPLPWDEDPQ